MKGPAKYKKVANHGIGGAQPGGGGGCRGEKGGEVQN